MGDAFQRTSMALDAQAKDDVPLNHSRLRCAVPTTKDASRATQAKAAQRIQTHSE